MIKIKFMIGRKMIGGSDRTWLLLVICRYFLGHFLKTAYFFGGLSKFLVFYRVLQESGLEPSAELLVVFN